MLKYKENLIEAINLLDGIASARADNRLSLYYPDEDRPGFPARAKYQKHLEFFAAGKTTFARLAMCANGFGKTEGLGGYEVICHARGWYPEWWPGCRFERPIEIWIAGNTRETTRDIQQTKLLGRPYEEGVGMIPRAWVDYGSIKRISNTAGAISSFRVRRVDGKFSYIAFKSYDQGLSSFYGTEKDIIWLDEPPPVDIYSQCVARTRNRTGAMVMVTATPIEGRTETIKLFLDQEDQSRTVIRAGWKHAPHLDEEWKKNARANTPAYLLSAVENGEPSMTGMAVYPIQEKEFVVDPFPIPKHYKWVFGLDTGLHNTASLWCAYDADKDTLYFVSDYKAGAVSTSGDVIDYSIHAVRIKSRSKILSGMDDMPGVADAAAVNIKDGSKMLDLYRGCGLSLILPNKAVDAGISKLTERLINGKAKVFKTCELFLDEYRSYRTNDDGKIIKTNDHLLDCARYICMSGLQIAIAPSKKQINIPKVSFG